MPDTFKATSSPATSEGGGVKVTLPNEPVGWNDSLQHELESLGYVVSSTTSFNLPRGWHDKGCRVASKIDCQLQQHVDENKWVRASLFVKNYPGEVSVSFRICEPPYVKYEAREDPLEGSKYEAFELQHTI